VRRPGHDAGSAPVEGGPERLADWDPSLEQTADRIAAARASGSPAQSACLTRVV
jgi:hypothetical protein